jgi:hypothetical protein
LPKLLSDRSVDGTALVMAISPRTVNWAMAKGWMKNQLEAQS